MAIDMKDVREQLQRQRDEKRGNAPPKKIEMNLCGSLHMVLERDRAQFEELGYVFAGPYREGKQPPPPAPTPAKAKTETKTEAAAA